MSSTSSMSSSSASSVISHYKRKMERHPKESDVLLHCLSKLDRVEVNIALLQETGIGRVVNSLKKSDQEDVSEKARLLVAKWKDVVAKEDDEGEEEGATTATTTNSLPQHEYQEDQDNQEDQDDQDSEEEENGENEDEDDEEEVEEEEEKPPTPSPPPSPPQRSSSHHKKHHKKKKSSHRDSGHRKSSSSSSQSHGSSKKQKNETLKASDSFGHALMNISGSGTGSGTSGSSSSSTSSKKKKSSKEDRAESSSHKRTHSESSTSKRSHSESSSSHKKSHSELASSSSSSKKSSSHLESSSKKSSHSESSRSKKSSDMTESVSIPSSDLLPTISPNYKPLPPKKESNNGVKRFQNDDEALSSLISMSKSSKRTAVFSGVKKSGYFGPIPSLMEMCITVLQEHVDYIYECGGLDFITLKPILERASPQTLAQIEEHNQYLMTETGDLWERFCKKNFPKEKRQEMESWREMFERCTVEREEKLNFLKVKVKDSYKKVESSYRQTKLAYVGTVAKPPRSVFRAQAKNGTAIPFGNPLKRPMANSGAGTSKSSSSSSISSAAPKKPKMAPLMSKTLKMARGIKGGFRR